ncbi:MAG: Smr/MutS family protein [Bacteroidota bacterium]
MKFSIGDKIILKLSGDEGLVTAYINDKMVEVDVHGITFPVYTDEIDHPYLKWFTEKKIIKKTAPEQLPVEKEKFRKPRLAKGVYLSFLPVYKAQEVEDIVENIKVYLLNELPQAIKFGYDMRVANKSEFAHEGTLHAFGHLHLHTISFETMNDQPRFQWQLDDAEDPENAPADGVLRIRPVRLFEHINELLQQNEPTFSYLLIEDFTPSHLIPKKEVPEPLNISDTKPPVDAPEAPRYELDLHIEALMDNTRGMSNADILKVQLDALHRYVYLAINHHQERMFIIHGLGKGVLRDAVHQELSSIPEVDRYVNEWHGSYGFGATEVFFRY